MLRTKAFEMPRTDPIYADLSIDVSHVQPANGVSKTLSSIPEIVRNS
jgi:hypothetical protein